MSLPDPGDLGDRVLATAPVAAVRETLSGEPVWVVGGTVRDVALGLEPDEVDLAVPGDPGAVAKKVAAALDGVAFELSELHPAWRVRGRDGSWQIDVASLRGEDGLTDDLERRDFTLGAVAVDLSSGEVFDPTGGLDDLRSGLLRACSERAFTDDPLRLMRAARLGSRFGWRLESHTLELARRAAPLAGDPAGERILAELLALVSGPDPLGGIEIMDSIGLLDSVLPEIGALRNVTQGPNHHLDVFGHTLEVLAGVLRIEADPVRYLGEFGEPVAALLNEPLADGVTRATGLRLAAMFHDCAKPETRREEGGFISFHGHDRAGAEKVRRIFGSRFKASRRLRGYVAGLTANHLVLGTMVADRPLDRHRIYRYLTRTWPDPVDVTLLTVADRLAARGSAAIAGDEVVAAHLELARELVGFGLEWHRNGPPEPPIGGTELAARLGIEPGPLLGELLEQLRTARFAGEIETADDAVGYARGHLETR